MIQVTEIPFAQMIRLEPADSPYLFCLPAHQDYTNHLGTVAAAAQFSLAEFASGQWLLNTFADLADQVIPMLRSSNVKFKKPASGCIRAKVMTAESSIASVRLELHERKRTLCLVEVVVVNDDDAMVMSGTFEWFLMMK